MSTKSPKSKLFKTQKAFPWQGLYNQTLNPKPSGLNEAGESGAGYFVKQAHRKLLLPALAKCADGGQVQRAGSLGLHNRILMRERDPKQTQNWDPN